ncbi:threonylcarbamoyl-AMP synthase [Canibacter sp. lx-72]|uniref:L-threonylcarbamoyladenylate synthase n=1 Tax=Canibacter zhuwentaonis TaxID=2837491 RepID=UPI001BDD2E33|nr:L-threonylcarbamoyladenylate synthase [Canibacter zhuwentaonis]MBT1017635.1 threonylcarbamoyl-AMP synthase [Canibacter zhuwentaonis]
MSELFNCSLSEQMLQGFRAARAALGRGELAVLPTDTVYGVAADAFNSAAVQKLIAAKGRTRQSPPPVLVSSVQTVHALAADVPAQVLQLTEQFWPGPLTVVTLAQPSLTWDLGDTFGTVALRMPKHDFTLQLLAETGPLAVSSANLHGAKPALTAAESREQLGDSVAVYLETGRVAGDGTASTIIDVTALNKQQESADQPALPVIKILRSGAITAQQLADALPQVLIER